MKNNFVVIDSVKYYKVSNSEKINPFFIQVPSSSDIWIFMSSNGGVTAGRRNSLGNLFPYETDDKLTLDYETGSKTLIKVSGKIWQPFEVNGVQKYNITRNIYKSCYANSVIIEEVNHDLKLTYSYKYESSEKFGFVKTSKFTNNSADNQEIEVLDGLMNIMPYGVNQQLQSTGSTLVDAYKAAEMVENNLALFTLTSEINDTPHPLEMLKANIAYNTLNCNNVYLSPVAIKEFLNNQEITCERDSYGSKCGYFVVYKKVLEVSKDFTYSFVLDNGYDHSKIAEIKKIVDKADFSELYKDIGKGINDIIEIVKKADGIQNTADEIACATHYLNTLYNCMRGGIFEQGYEFDYNDFVKFVNSRNKSADKDLLDKLKECKNIHELKETSKQDELMYRLALEYMPLSFSRRHGDPSRPWNKFNIQLKDENGEKTINYEGNWRDIFQNWEALGTSYPSYYENMLAKFVNASTFDGYNPYRISTAGIDWEKPEPENPFGGLGYWGDHQIIYLLRLLQGLKNHFPSKLNEMLSMEVFSYANVPYVITSYEDILKDSKNTICFDFEKDQKIEELVAEIGSDARLILKDEKVLTVTLTEKLLVPVLSKISNLLAGGGIWMNTQRPEWNDANNAIVGIGLSMVTVYHVAAYLDFLLETLSNSEDSLNISETVVAWLLENLSALKTFEDNYKGNEKALLDKMGYSFSDYRKTVLETGLGDKKSISKEKILEWITLAKKLVSYTVDMNKGDAYSSYNLLKDDFTIEKMRVMLEGQSAVIGSGMLSSNEVIALADSIKKDLYSETLRCHTLYPLKKTKKFYEKNILSLDIEPIENVVIKDVDGKLHFSPEINCEQELKNRLENVSEPIKSALLEEYENQFSHKKFNGRSEVMYKFEGIGCVYWHQNAKFLLAILETAQKAKEKGEDITEIYKLYNDLLQGFIYRKSPEECSAIPIEPYSHTSFSGKSEQPGMTGQVKESVLMRRGELGIKVKNGEISFEPEFVREDEFGDSDITFTVCSIPVKYVKSDKKQMIIKLNDDTTITQDVFTIDANLSYDIFARNSNISAIELYI